MNSLDSHLAESLASLRQQGLYRDLHPVESCPSSRIEVGGKTLLNFSSNDYLGLANEPGIKEAAMRAIERYGAGAGSSRLLCGSLAPHHELDDTIAEFKGAEAALSFSSGYATAIGAVCALVGKGDVVIIDKLAHACIVDAARLSGATLRAFAHNDLADLEQILKWAAARPRSTHQAPRSLIVTESVFSMDGDAAPLRELITLKEHHGAWLMLDEAHAVGLYGPNRRGLAEACGVGDRIEVQMGTLGKAAGSAGGYICGSRALIDFLVNRARSFIFSTAPVPAAAAAAAAGIHFISSRAGKERCERLWQRVEEFNLKMNRGSPQFKSAIVPVHVGSEAAALAAATALRERGFFVPAIRYPTVARGRARLRVTLTASHLSREIGELAAALQSLGLGS